MSFVEDKERNTYQTGAIATGVVIRQTRPLIVVEFTPTEYKTIMKHLDFYISNDLTGLMN